MFKIQRSLTASVAMALTIAVPAMALQISANPTNLGTPFPDATGTPTCGNTASTPLDITFNVSTVVNPITSIGLRFNATHSYRNDLSFTLIAPGGSPSHLIFARTGATAAANACGSATDLVTANTLNFGDSATLNWATTVANPVPAGYYRTSATGDLGSGSPVTLMNPVFAGLTPAQANGTWTLRIQDMGVGDTGSLQSAVLFIDETAPVSLQKFSVE